MLANICSRIELSLTIPSFATKLLTTSTRHNRGSPEGYLDVILDEDTTVAVASLPGLFLLKLSAWKDRCQKTDRDAEDIAGLLDEYLEINYDRAVEQHPDIFEHEGFTIPKAGADLIGRDIRHLLQRDIPLCEEIRSIVADELAKREESLLIRQILEIHRWKRYEDILDTLISLEKALKQR
jgi:predicted nucleotidyltransferase